MTSGQAEASADPSDEMSIYKRLEDVPTKYRLTAVQAELRGEDTWTKFVDDRDEVNRGLSESRLEKYDRCGRTWKRHTRSVGRHHACARPQDVESFVSKLDADLAIGSIYETYFGPLFVFYDWLWHHAEYPHRYSPVLLAAGEEGTALKCWNYRIELR